MQSKMFVNGKSAKAGYLVVVVSIVFSPPALGRYAASAMKLSPELEKKTLLLKQFADESVALLEQSNHIELSFTDNGAVDLTQKDRNALASFADRLSGKLFTSKIIPKLTKDQLRAGIEFFKALSATKGNKTTKLSNTLSLPCSSQDLGDFLRLANSDDSLWDTIPRGGNRSSWKSHGATFVAFRGGDENTKNEDRKGTEDVAEKIRPLTGKERIEEVRKFAKEPSTPYFQNSHRPQATLEAAAPLPAPHRSNFELRAANPGMKELSSDRAVYLMAQMKEGNAIPVMQSLLVGGTITALGGVEAAHHKLDEMLLNSQSESAISRAASSQGILSDSGPFQGRLNQINELIERTNGQTSLVPSVQSAADGVAGLMVSKNPGPQVGFILLKAARDYLVDSDKERAAKTFERETGIAVKDLADPAYAPLIHSMIADTLLAGDQSHSIGTLINGLEIRGGIKPGKGKIVPVDILKSDPEVHFAHEFPLWKNPVEREKFRLTHGVRGDNVEARVRALGHAMKNPKSFAAARKARTDDELKKLALELSKLNGDKIASLDARIKWLIENGQKEEAEKLKKEKDQINSASLADTADFFRAIAVLSGGNKPIYVAATVFAAHFDLGSKIASGSWGGATLVLANLLSNLMGLGAPNYSAMILQEVREMRAEVKGYHFASVNRDAEAARAAKENFAQVMEALDALESHLTASERSFTKQMQHLEHRQDEGNSVSRINGELHKTAELNNIASRFGEACMGVNCDPWLTPTASSDKAPNRQDPAFVRDYNYITVVGPERLKREADGKALPPIYKKLPVQLSENENASLAIDYQLGELKRHSVNPNVNFATFAHDLEQNWGIRIAPPVEIAQRLPKIGFPLDSVVLREALSTFGSELKRAASFRSNPNGHLIHTANNEKKTYLEKVDAMESAICASDSSLAKLSNLIDAGNYQLAASKDLMAPDTHGLPTTNNLMGILAHVDSYIENLPTLLEEHKALLTSKNYKGFNLMAPVAQQTLTEGAKNRLGQMAQSIAACEGYQVLNSKQDPIENPVIGFSKPDMARDFAMKAIDNSVLIAAEILEARVKLCYEEIGFDTRGSAAIASVEENGRWGFVARYSGTPRIKIKAIIREKNGRETEVGRTVITSLDHLEQVYTKKFYPSWGIQAAGIESSSLFFGDHANEDGVFGDLVSRAKNLEPTRGQFNGFKSDGITNFESAQDRLIETISKLWRTYESQIASGTSSKVLRYENQTTVNQSENGSNIIWQADIELRKKAQLELEKVLTDLDHGTGPITGDLKRIEGASERVRKFLAARFGSRVFNDDFGKILSSLPNREAVLQEISNAQIALKSEFITPEVVKEAQSKLHDRNQALIRFLLRPELKLGESNPDPELQSAVNELTEAYKLLSSSPNWAKCRDLHRPFTLVEPDGDEKKKSLQIQNQETAKQEAAVTNSFIQKIMNSESTERMPLTIADLQRIIISAKLRSATPQELASNLDRVAESYVALLNGSYLLTNTSNPIARRDEAMAKMAIFGHLPSKDEVAILDQIVKTELALGKITTPVMVQRGDKSFAENPIQLTDRLIQNYANSGSHPVFGRLNAWTSELKTKQLALKDREDGIASLDQSLKDLQQTFEHVAGRKKDVIQKRDDAERISDASKSKFGEPVLKVLNDLIVVLHRAENRLDSVLKQKKAAQANILALSTEEIKMLANKPADRLEERNVEYFPPQETGSNLANRDFVAESPKEFRDISDKVWDLANAAKAIAQRDGSHWAAVQKYNENRARNMLIHDR